MFLNQTFHHTYIMHTLIIQELTGFNMLIIQNNNGMLTMMPLVYCDTSNLRASVTRYHQLRASVTRYLLSTCLCGAIPPIYVPLSRDTTNLRASVTYVSILSLNIFTQLAFIQSTSNLHKLFTDEYCIIYFATSIYICL